MEDKLNIFWLAKRKAGVDKLRQRGRRWKGVEKERDPRMEGAIIVIRKMDGELRWNLFKKVNGTEMETRGIKINGTVEGSKVSISIYSLDFFPPKQRRKSSSRVYYFLGIFYIVCSKIQLKIWRNRWRDSWILFIWGLTSLAFKQGDCVACSKKNKIGREYF